MCEIGDGKAVFFFSYSSKEHYEVGHLFQLWESTLDNVNWVESLSKIYFRITSFGKS